MLAWIRRKARERAFRAASTVEERGVAFLTEGHTGTHINLRYELWLNEHPIALLQHYKGERGQLYNDWEPKFFDSAHLVNRYLSRMLTEIPNSTSDMPRAERAHAITRYEPGTYDDYFLNHRRPGRLVFVEWDAGDWVQPATLNMEKYPVLERLALEYKFRDDLAGELGVIRQSMPSYQSFSVVRANAYTPADRIGSVYAHPFDHGKWTGKNLFKQRALFEDRDSAGRWVAISSFGGWKNTRDYYERRFGGRVSYLGGDASGK